MPGFAGVLAPRDYSSAPELLQAMLRAMNGAASQAPVCTADRNRGWFLGGAGLRSGPCSAQPIHNEDESISLWLVGECFVDRDTRSALKRSGHWFEEEGPSCLVHLYEEQGARFLADFDGLFSGILLDARLGRAILFTDRFALRRIYYVQDATGFYFSSEAKSLLAAVPALRDLDTESLAEYLCFDCVLGERTLFRGIRYLPGGALWTLDRGKLKQGRWYDPQSCRQAAPLRAGEFRERLAVAFERAVQRRVDGSPMGLALSGGLDTRLIAASLPADHEGLRAFTVGGMYRDSVDLCIARRISEICGLEHETLRVGKEFIADYAAIAAQAVYATDGLADATTAHTFYADGKVRSGIAPTVMSGAFGSQVLGRVRSGLRYRAPDPGLVHGDFEPYVAAAAGALAKFPQERSLAGVAQREIPWYWSRFISAHLAWYELRLPFLDTAFFDLLFRAPAEGYDGSAFEMEAIGNRSPELMRLRTNQGCGGVGPAPIRYLLGRCVRCRAKLEKIFNWDVLPHSLQHTAARIDAHILTPLRFDRLILGWEYYQHYNRWFRNELAGTLREMLLDPRSLTRPYWSTACVRRIVEDHVAGRRNNLAQIRKILTIELIHRELLERTEFSSGSAGGEESGHALESAGGRRRA